MKIAEAISELRRVDEYISYLEDKIALGFKIKELDSESGDKFIKDAFSHIDICFKKKNKLQSQIYKALVVEKFDKEGSLMDAINTIKMLRKKRDIFDKSMAKFVEIGDINKVRRSMEQFNSVITLLSKTEKNLISLLNEKEVSK